ncbi:MAG: ketoacyl-ACP synthase III [Deltaproteobacteria bacterium]|nr:ketoacyl-ACP synthase III [Deltaproteobacteria bacterium]
MDKTRNVLIEGIGHYLPQRKVTNAELSAETGIDSDWIAQSSGVHTRHRADRKNGESTPYLAAQAAREAFEEAGCTVEDVDLIISASGTHYESIPDTATFIQAELGAGRSGIPCFGMHTSCLSFLTAMDAAASFLATARYRRILIVTAEIASAGLNYADRETGPLFGDGAAAAVVRLRQTDDPVSPFAAIHAMRFETYGDDAKLSGVPGGGTRLPLADSDVKRSDGVFRMNGGGLLKRATKTLPRFLQKLYPELGTEAEKDTVYVLHQASAAGFRLVERLGLAPERTVRTLTEYGNCIGASLPLTLHKAIRTGKLRRGQKCLMIGTAAGVTYGGALLTY